ncbi:MAG: GNAT family N-acetyltransferase [Chloroflexales bacterium]|nr:GNAT family N-acetyltransferase [Chloroflexales bacterium]
MASHPIDRLHIQVMRGELISDIDRRNIISLCNRAYEEDIAALFNTFVDATHVLGYFDGSLVGHALWVTRYLQAGTNPMMRTAYVEAVATEPAYRNRGFATSIMKYLVSEVQDYDLAALSPTSVTYYERLGWELWQGALSIRTENGLLPSSREEEVMIFRLSKTPSLDLSAPLSAEWRGGELW